MSSRVAVACRRNAVIHTRTDTTIVFAIVLTVTVTAVIVVVVIVIRKGFSDISRPDMHHMVQREPHHGAGIHTIGRWHTLSTTMVSSL